MLFAFRENYAAQVPSRRGRDATRVVVWHRQDVLLSRWLQQQSEQASRYVVLQISRGSNEVRTPVCVTS